jgi:hypothetical protein
MIRSFSQFKKGLAATKFTAMTIKIDPPLAKEMLKRNKQNRRYRDTRAEKLAEDMRNGLWRRTGEAISFLRDGILLSGQHRLNAIIKSGTTQEFTVAFCADSDATMFEGVGVKFTANDHLARNGFRNLADANGGAIIRHMRLAFNNPRGGLRAHEVINFADKYKESVSFAAECFKGIKDRRIAIAPVLAVIARAYCARPSKRADIKRFCSIMRDGVIPKVATGGPVVLEERDRCPMAMRELLIQQRNHKASDIQQTYRKMETALVRFLEKRDLASPLFGAREELFPIQEDETPVEAATASTRYFCIPTKALKVDILSKGKVKSLMKQQILPLRDKKMTRIMRSNDKFCVLGFNGKGYAARICGSIKKVDVRGRDIRLVLKDSQVVNGPLLNSVRSALTGIKQMPARVFASSIRALDQRDFERLVKP